MVEVRLYRGIAARKRFAPRTLDYESILELLASKQGEARLRIASDADFASVIAIARRTTDIVSFAYQPPTLSELFRRAVAA